MSMIEHARVLPHRVRHHASLWTRFVQQVTLALHSRAMELLAERVFPRVVAYATHPYTISGTILLLVPLIVFNGITALALVLGNYTNVVSAAVSSIVLYQGMKHHQELRHMHEQHARDMADLRAHIVGADKKVPEPEPPTQPPVRRKRAARVSA